jgi:hypothetical protein
MPTPPPFPLNTARMVEAKQLIAATKNKAPGQELQPKEVIATNAQIREHMRQLSEDYKEIERLYQKERGKRRVRAVPCCALLYIFLSVRPSQVNAGTTLFFSSSSISAEPNQNQPPPHTHPHLHRQSKFSPEELEVRGQMVQQMLAEIQELKEASLQGYVRGYQGNVRAGLIMPMEESEAFKGPLGAYMRNRWVWQMLALPLASVVTCRYASQPGHSIHSFILPSSSFPPTPGSMPMQTGMTEDHRVQVQQLQQRDKDMDAKYLDQIEQGVEDLRDIALRANEAVKTTNVMLENLEQKIIDVQDHLDRVNRKMKTTLDQVGRRSDKMCIDIICIIILLGMVGVLYNLIKNSKSFK